MNKRIKKIAVRADKERIKELWEQSTGAKFPEEGFYSSASKYNIEKFAELIIKECSGVCDNDYVRCGQDGAGWRLAREIEEHFGVEK